MRTVFVTGKGGVGKSTLSAALARQLAGRGQRVLAVSLDPAHNLGDIFGVDLSGGTRRFAPGLWLREVDFAEAADSSARENVALLQEAYGYLASLNLDAYFQVLKYAPGTEEHAGLRVLEQILTREKDRDFIVFDTPPTGQTLRLLALPSVTLVWLERLSRIRAQILDKRHTIQAIRGMDGGGTRLTYDPDEDPVMRKLTELKRRYETLVAHLKGEDNAIAVVFNPDRLSLRESERLIKGLEDLELPLRAAFNNKVSPENRDLASRVEGELLKSWTGGRCARVPFTEAADPGAGAGCALAHDLVAALPWDIPAVAEDRA